MKKQYYFQENDRTVIGVCNGTHYGGRDVGLSQRIIDKRKPVQYQEHYSL